MVGYLILKVFRIFNGFLGEWWLINKSSCGAMDKRSWLMVGGFWLLFNVWLVLVVNGCWLCYVDDCWLMGAGCWQVFLGCMLVVDGC